MPTAIAAPAGVNPLIPVEVKSHRFLELDSLRGLAAFSVVFYHFTCIWISEPWAHWARMTPARVLIGGHEAVVFFFVLSGFVLSLPFQGSRPPSYPSYLAQRIVRIYLPFAAAVCIAVGCNLAFFSQKLHVNGWVDGTWSIRPTWGILASVLETRHDYTQETNAAFWTINLELHISLLFPLLYFALRRLRAELVLAALFLLALMVSLHGSLARALPIVLATGMFAIGSVLALHFDRVMALFGRLSAARRGLWIAASAGLFWGPMMIAEAINGTIVDHSVQDYCIALGAVGLMVACLGTPKIRGFLRHPLLLRGGALSYSIYLLHATVLWSLIHLFYGKISLGWILPIYLPLAWAAAELFHACVDQPAVLLGRAAGKFVRQRFG